MVITVSSFAFPVAATLYSSVAQYELASQKIYQHILYTWIQR